MRPVASGIHRRFLIVASSGGGGDLQPLLALADGLRARGHGVSAFGDTEVQIRMHRLGVEKLLPVTNTTFRCNTPPWFAMRGICPLLNKRRVCVIVFRRIGLPDYVR